MTTPPDWHEFFWQQEVLLTTPLTGLAWDARVRDLAFSARLRQLRAGERTVGHPSGDPSPSPDDLELTRRLVATGNLLGIDVLDHIVVGDGRYYSFKEGSCL